MKKKVQRKRTRPNYMQREFWNSVKGMSGGQWGEGFVSGVISFTRFMNRRHAIIVYILPSKPSKKTKPKK